MSRWSSQPISTSPRGSIVIVSQPRLPGAPALLTAREALNVRPPSAERATRIVVPSRFDTQDTAISAPRTATRGGCSPVTRASPATSFTRTGAPNVRPASPLAAA